MVVALKAAKDFEQFKMIVERLLSFKKCVYYGNKMPYEKIAKIGYSLAQENEDYIYLHKVLENNISKLFLSQLKDVLESRCS